MRFIITGFGPFGRIAENPSEKVAAEATQIVKGMGIDCSFVQLKASIRAVDKFYTDVNDPGNLFVINIGVDASSTNMVIERYGKNIKDFVIPDAEGEQPRDQPINASMKMGERLENKVDVPGLAARLPGKFEPNEDAGEYVCNYCYFNALEAVGKKVKGALFVHIPIFKVIDLKTQAQNVADLVQVLNEHYSQ